MTPVKIILGTAERDGREVTIPPMVYEELMKFCLDKRNGSFTLHVNKGVITEVFEVRYKGKSLVK